MTTFPVIVFKDDYDFVRRRRWWRWTLALGIALVLATAWWWGPRLVEQVTLARLQRQCLTHVPAPGQISYADAGLYGERTYRAAPVVWESLAHQINAGSIMPSAAPFVGQRRDRDGQRRLVIVELLDPRPVGPHRVLDARVRIVETSPWSGPRVIRDQMILGTARIPVDAKVRIFAGQPDPRDPSHFTIGYQVEGAAPGTIDGWLMDDQMRLEARPVRRELLTMGTP